jgi:hypothetical protein
MERVMPSIPRKIAYSVFGFFLIFSFLPFAGFKPVLLALLIAEFIKSRVIKKVALVFKVSTPAKMINLIGLEFVTVGSLIAGVMYGSRVGMSFGVIAMITHYLGRMYYPLYAVVNIPMYAIFGGIAGFLTSTNFIFMGVIMNIGYIILNSIILFVLFKPKVYFVSFYAVTNVMINLILIPFTYSLVIA